MRLPADYEWYPQFTSTDDLVTMKLPDGSLMKMFLAMQAADMGTTEALKWLAAIENYPAFSNGVTLGGHGVRPKEEALGAGNGLKGCRSCHATGGMMTNPIPVTRKTVVPMGDMGDVELPQYQWHFYNIHALADLGLTVEDGDIVAGTADVDIEGDTNLVRVADQALLLNWFAPTAPVPEGFISYTPADNAAILGAVGLTADELTKNGGSWMPVLEPLTDPVPNYRVLGYDSSILWMD